MRCVVIKTSAESIHSVVKQQMHATETLPLELEPGTLLLIHQKASGKTIPPRITHTMLVDRCEEDRNGLSLRSWGKKWRWIIYGRDIQALAYPIPISRLGRALGKNYGQGAQRFVYLDPADLVDLKEAGLISSAVDRRTAR
jgi:hypothetical protein